MRQVSKHFEEMVALTLQCSGGGHVARCRQPMANCVEAASIIESMKFATAVPYFDPSAVVPPRGDTRPEHGGSEE